MDWTTLAAIATVSVAAITIVGFWMHFSDKVTNAAIAAASAKETAKENSERIATMNAAFALYREQVARDYISREMMQEFERRLTTAIDRLGERFDKFLEATFNKGHDK